jgi:chorismate synthase
MLQFITSGESHGQYLIAILEGLPSGLRINIDAINRDLAHRQKGYGRGARMHIESDMVTITSRLYRKKTTGAPMGLMIQNREVKIFDLPQLLRPRPGHADLTGALKYNQGIREVLERSSARETALRVAIGAVARQLLEAFDISVLSHVIRIGKKEVSGYGKFAFAEIQQKIERSKMNCISLQTEKQMKEEIDKALKKGDTIGGECELIATGVPLGLGSHTHYARKIDARLAAALMSVQAVKAVQFGLGCDYASKFGSQAHDEIFYSKAKGYYRKTNNAGGIEGGMTNGSDIRVRITMKPIATLKKPLRSVDMQTKRPQEASFERSDVCAVPACGVIGEAVMAYEIANAFLDKFGGDSLREIKRNYQGYLKQISV